MSVFETTKSRHKSDFIFGRTVGYVLINYMTCMSGICSNSLFCLFTLYRLELRAQLLWQTLTSQAGEDDSSWWERDHQKVFVPAPLLQCYQPDGELCPGVVVLYCCLDVEVPLSLMAAWAIYSQPARYRSLFPHNEARQQAVASKRSILPFIAPQYSHFSSPPHCPLLPSPPQTLAQCQCPPPPGGALRLPPGPSAGGTGQAQPESAADCHI